ncbi:MAG: hypothetical protein ACK5IP_04895, partial [Paracoccus sp. (in: a-proteobacteria)]
MLSDASGCPDHPGPRDRSFGGLPTALNAHYYAQRAGAGLVVVESTAVSARGVGWPNTPGIFSDAQIAGWRLVTDAVHSKGGRIFCQLWHCGRNSHVLTQPRGVQPVGPSLRDAGGGFAIGDHVGEAAVEGRGRDKVEAVIAADGLQPAGADAVAAKTRAGDGRAARQARCDGPGRAAGDGITEAIPPADGC